MEFKPGNDPPLLPANKKFKREINALDSVFEFLADFLTANKIGKTDTYATNFAVEELFTNMVKYNPEGTKDIFIGLAREDNNIVVNMVDYDVEPFDPYESMDVDVTKPLEEREPGGLGLYLVRNIVDRITFEYKDNNVHVTVIKSLED